MQKHADRDHATWSASSTDRNWNCSGALALTFGLPDTTSEAADWGTVAHEISERCLTTGKDAADFIGTREKGKKYSFEVDEEMAETAQMYVDYVNRSWKGMGPVTKSLLWIEQRFSLASLNPPFDAGGTGDAVIWKPAERQIEVVDLKGGRGVVVEAKGNPQLRTYGLGALLTNPGLPVETIKVTIVQPRAGHKDGRIRSETFDVAELIEWTADLLAAMLRSAQALADHEKIGHTVTKVEWAKVHLNAGDHCKFCKAAGFCPALEQKALDAAGVWFNDQDQPTLSNAPDDLSPERMAQLLDAADMIEDWINAVRRRAFNEADAGVQIPHYVLVEKTGREKWVAEDVEAALETLVEAFGVDRSKIFNAPKARTPKQVRDALKKAKLDPALTAGLSETPAAGKQLVRETKTTREAVPSKADAFFTKLD